MLFQLLLSNPIEFVVVAAALILSFTVHEFAHAFAADKLGDPTARLQGRLTLNPLSHLDPIGTLAIFFFGFGWGKPVPFDPYNLREPKRDSALIAAAGPASNILLALLFALLIKVVPAPLFILEALAVTVAMNINLAIFNLIPVHPLDGGKILIGLAPRSIAHEWDDILHRYGTIILFMLIFPFNGRSAVGSLLSPIVSTILGILL